MRVSIVTAQLPYIIGGAEQQAEDLMTALKERGHEADLILIPFAGDTLKNLIKSIVAARAMPIGGGNPDLVIGFKFPAYLAPFPKKKLWLPHQHRPVYDLWGSDYHDMPDTLQARRTRDTVIRADNACFRTAKAIYTTTHNVARRLKKFNGIEATGILYPPLPAPHLYSCGCSDNYFLYVSRITSLKRQLIAVSAMRYVKSDFKLLIAGAVSQRKYQAYLEATISAYHLEDRVQFLGAVSDGEKAARMANATGVVYTPYDEDYGYVTLEALQSCKPVITCHDSGTVAEFIEDGVNGLVVAPDAREVAEAMERLFADKLHAAQMGRNGRALLDARNINWDTVVDALLAP